MTKKAKADIPIWKQHPKIGEKWRREGSFDIPTETRTVVERTLGGHVGYVSGRWTRFSKIFTITLEHWKQWERWSEKVKP